MNYRRFVYYQPNEKDVKDNYGDCTIRAICKVMDLTWLEAFDLLMPYAREYQTPNIFFLPRKECNDVMDKLGFEYVGVSNKKGSRRPTVDSFARDHQSGRYILNVAHHEVAVVDGKYYDTWDCGYKALYGWYELKEEAMQREEKR